MGFDVYGMNPVERVIKEEKYSTFNKYNKLEWEERTKLFKKDDKLEDKYWNEYRLREEENCGVYFRNNCWWWRPLWNYVCNSCLDVMDGDDMEGGGWNNGYKISEAKASAIAKRLFELIDSGDTKGYEDHHKEQSEESNASNERYLANGGKEYGDGWDWAESYPFNVENVRDFAKFCSESGGFEIC